MKKIKTIVALGVIVLTTLTACFGGRATSLGRGDGALLSLLLTE